MNSATDIDPQSARSWAAEQLAVATDVSPQQARCTFFQRLERADFSPPEAWVQAVRVLDPSTSSSSDLAKGAEREIQAARMQEGQLAIDEFASRFWESVPQERREYWHHLRGRYAEVSRLIERLDRLEPGLDLVIGQAVLADENTAKNLLKMAQALHDNIVEWFPLAPVIRASLRRNWLAGIQRNRQWESAAELLTEHRSGIVALDPELVAFLRANSRRIMQVRASAKVREKTARASQVASYTNDSSGRGLWWIALIAISIFVKVVGSCSPSSRSPGPTSMPTYSRTSYKTDSDLLNLSKMTAEQEAILDALQSTKTVAIPTKKTIPDWLRIPDRFNKDGSPKVLDWVPGEVPSPGEKAWRNAGGKYRHEDTALPRTPKGAYLP